MGDMWQAWQFIQKTGALGRRPEGGLPGARMSLSPQNPMEMGMKAFLARRQGIDGSLAEINRKYEVQMTLVPRRQPLSEDVLAKADRITEAVEARLNRG